MGHVVQRFGPGPGPGPGVSLPGCCLCDCLAVPSRGSYLTSLNSDFIFCKMGIILSAPHKVVERIKGASAQCSSVGTKGDVC